MNKTNRSALVVLALLGTTAAFAQSSVTLYGRVGFPQFPGRFA